MPLHVGPGRTIEARTPLPSSSICSALIIPSRPHLPAEYAAMNGRGRTATSDETKTMSPRRRSTIAGANARTIRWAPTRLRSISRPNRSEVTSMVAPGATRPALLTTTSISPRSAVALAAKSATDASSVTSSRCATASPPSARTAAAISSRASTRRAPSATGCPAAARTLAVSAPIPDDAPVITAGRRSGCWYFFDTVSPSAA